MVKAVGAKLDVKEKVEWLLGRLAAIRPPNMSEADWCRAAHVSGQTFQDMRRKGSEPGVFKVDRLARAAGLSIGELIDGQGAGSFSVPSDDVLAEILKAFAPALSAAQVTEASIQAVAQELGVVLQTVGSNDEYERSPERLQGLLDRALVVIERSQRDKSQSG
ncbi:hypothetical protein GG804_25180 [Sphingomonas histidinilytica]|uniref:hypothetical protein n=1 Tax=Rhizorhabdus histidinilytica TaxID=439228 RepID=UPI001ADCCD42|nr:hypothetical protein [Rhizorhabdus histidinilytica]MBO9380066.1 hypothetical protein [Rhizorhabdus histidinilytica]